MRRHAYPVFPLLLIMLGISGTGCKGSGGTSASSVDTLSSPAVISSGGNEAASPLSASTTVSTPAPTTAPSGVGSGTPPSATLANSASTLPPPTANPPARNSGAATLPPSPLPPPLPLPVLPPSPPLTTMTSVKIIRPNGMKVLLANARQPVPMPFDLELTFTQAVDPAATQQAFSLTTTSLAPNNSNVTGTFSWNSGNTVMRFSPSVQLGPNASFVLNLTTARFVTSFTTMTSGDINGDGTSEFLIGSPNFDAPPIGMPTNLINAGTVSLYNGRSIQSNLSPSLGHITGGIKNGYFGSSVAMIGDINGDGYEDFIVGEPGNGSFTGIAGNAYVFLGKSNIRSATRTTADAKYTFHGESAADQFGAFVEGLGDINGDGVPDFAVIAPAWRLGNGKVYLYSGGDQSVLGTIQGDTATTGFGSSIAGGDIDGDGINDIVIGAATYASGSGTVYIFRGGSANLSANMTPQNAWRSIQGQSANERFGAALAVVGDVNGDGRADIVVGAPHPPHGPPTPITTDQFLGTVYLLSSGATGMTVLGSVNGENVDDHLGSSVAAVGDVNADKVPDFIVGNHNVAGGPAYIFSGASFRGVQQASAAIMKLTSSTGGDEFAYSVAGGGDITGDFIPDVVIGSPNANTAYVYQGPSFTTRTLVNGAVFQGAFGFPVAGTGAGF